MFRSLTNIMQKISSNHRLKKYFIYDKIKEMGLGKEKDEDSNNKK